MRHRPLCTAVLCALVWALSPLAIAQQDEQASYFTDVELVDQDGKTRRLYTDLMKGKVVLIAPLHVNCTSIGPPMMSNLAAIQKALGDRAGRQVHILTITVDPAAETPAKVAAYARTLNPKPGWFFLSGKKENVDVALRKFGLYVETPDAHSN